jgi:hypothetical protein
MNDYILIVSELKDVRISILRVQAAISRENHRELYTLVTI